MADMTTEDRLRAIEARANAATPGTWIADGKIISVYGIRLGAFYGGNVRKQNAEFAAHARSDIPWLIAELRAAQTALADTKADYLRRHKDACDRYLEIEELCAENARMKAVVEAARPIARGHSIEEGEVIPRCPMCRLESAIAAPAERAWRPIDENTPKNQKMLVFYRNALGNGRTITACYHTYLPWSDNADYGPEDGEYAPEGWYEESETHEELHFTDCLPTHWMPLPEPPK